jgi:hypothetical protein
MALHFGRVINLDLPEAHTYVLVVGETSSTESIEYRNSIAQDRCFARLLPMFALVCLAKVGLMSMHDGMIPSAFELMMM